jgi:hypothetical protein
VLSVIYSLLQIRMGCRYLKDTLKYSFPEVRERSARAAAEERQRQARPPFAKQRKPTPFFMPFVPTKGMTLMHTDGTARKFLSD